MILIGLGVIVANPTTGLTVGSIWILIFGILPLVVAIRSGKKFLQNLQISQLVIEGVSQYSLHGTG
jgi:hypothetical protein